MGTTFNKVSLKSKKKKTKKTENKKTLTEFVLAIKQYIKCKPDTEKKRASQSLFSPKKFHNIT